LGDYDSRLSVRAKFDAAGVCLILVSTLATSVLSRCDRAVTNGDADSSELGLVPRV